MKEGQFVHKVRFSGSMRELTISAVALSFSGLNKHIVLSKDDPEVPAVEADQIAPEMTTLHQTFDEISEDPDIDWAFSSDPFDNIEEVLSSHLTRAIPQPSKSSVKVPVEPLSIQFRRNVETKSNKVDQDRNMNQTMQSNKLPARATNQPGKAVKRKIPPGLKVNKSTRVALEQFRFQPAKQIAPSSPARKRVAISMEPVTTREQTTKYDDDEVDQCVRTLKSILDRLK